MTERAYKATDLTVSSLNSTFMLKVYQMELSDGLTSIAETSVNSWILFKCLAMLVQEERVRWLNMNYLLVPEKIQDLSNTVLVIYSRERCLWGKWFLGCSEIFLLHYHK